MSQATINNLCIDLDELQNQIDFLELALLNADDTDKGAINGLLNLCEAIKDQAEGYTL